jgi:hypothetical protein
VPYLREEPRCELSEDALRCPVELDLPVSLDHLLKNLLRLLVEAVGVQGLSELDPGLPGHGQDARGQGQQRDGVERPDDLLVRLLR